MEREPRLAEGAVLHGGHLLPEPTQVLLAPGDAVFVLHATPHSSTLNGWTKPRPNIYFRLVHKAAPR
jgi:hypothetical protein